MPKSSMNIKESYINIVISIIWGLSIAVLFKLMCKNNNCVIIKSNQKN
jgi:hypothetical protein